MNESEVGQFDDPALKAAVKRAWAHERAPLDLTARARSAMRQAVPPESDPSLEAIRGGWRIPRWVTYAAAALVALAVGAFTAFLADDSGQVTPRPGHLASASVLPASYLTGLVQRHDECRQRYADRHHTLACDQTNFEQIDAQLEAQMKAPVLVIDPRPDGWKFDGAAVCPVPVHRDNGTENVRASHLLFHRDGRQTLSVISVAFKGSCKAKPGETFIDEAGQNHLIVGFLDNEELHCLVGHSTDGSLTKEDLRRLSDKYQIAVQTIRLPHNMLLAPTAYVR